MGLAQSIEETEIFGIAVMPVIVSLVVAFLVVVFLLAVWAAIGMYTGKKVKVTEYVIANRVMLIIAIGLLATVLYVTYFANAYTLLAITG